ncbi:MAG: tetratricopeptide repeat protein [candidate division WOR-3 bacterium]|uniref:Tetratricopeptide repeat protein n=1 Tax=candidate division WOR-3 bacterium TaxID=2052148 RepID=A0A7C1SR38_UNCW3|nr:tetratricopeptide repeat protein [candidate division WOR-3 bacterium]
MSWFVFALIFLAQPDHALDCFQRANAAYEAGRFDEAVRLYDSTLLGAQSPTVYYNRGNAHFRANRVGLAIADYLRAWRLAPRDPDINFNLNFARQFRVDRNPNPEGIWSRFVRAIFTVFNPPVTRVITALIFFLSALFLAGYFLRHRSALLIIGLVLTVLFLFGLGSVWYWRGATDRNLAVVVVPEAIVRAGPGSEYREIAAVHDGLEVKIIEHRPEWVLIQIPGGLGGWIERSALERVFQ